jgi:type IV pilus assembly protein PilZ
VYQRTNAFIADWARNISKGGIFVETESPFNPGTVFDFQLALPGREDRLRLSGKVKWIQRVATEGLLGMGIQFVWNDRAEQAAFEKTVEELVVENLGQAVYEKLVKRA